MADPLEDPLYYLHNFRQVLDWLGQRYADLLDADEAHFIQQFDRLPQASQALLVRMVMRKGVHFRAGKLNYLEIGCPQAAAHPLKALGWIDDQCLLGFDELFGLLQKGEVLGAFQPWIDQPKGKKTDWLEQLATQFTEQRRFAHWCPELDDVLYSLTVMDLCDRLRLMFFGNLYQDWSEFVLADLGIYTYEKVEFCAESRGLRSRDDVLGFLFLHQCQQTFESAQAPDSVLAQIATLQTDNPWLEKRRAKLLFQVGQYCERSAELALAEQIYRACVYPGARALDSRAGAPGRLCPGHGPGMRRPRGTGKSRRAATPAACVATPAAQVGRAGLAQGQASRSHAPGPGAATAGTLDVRGVLRAGPSERARCAGVLRRKRPDQFAVRPAVLGGDLRAAAGGILSPVPARAGGSAQRRLSSAPCVTVRRLFRATAG